MPQNDIPGRDCWRVRIHWTYLQQLCETGFHVAEPTLNNFTAVQVRDAVKAWVDGSFTTLLSQKHFLNRLTVTHLTSGGFSQHIYGQQAGGHGPSSYPAPFAAIRVNMNSDSRYRHRNGRMFWPVRNADMTTESDIAGTNLTTYTAAITALQTALVASGIGTGLYLAVLAKNYTAADVLRPKEEKVRSIVNVTSMTMSPRATTMNTRKIGRGA